MANSGTRENHDAPLGCPCCGLLFVNPFEPPLSPVDSLVLHVIILYQQPTSIAYIHDIPILSYQAPLANTNHYFSIIKPHSPPPSINHESTIASTVDINSTSIMVGFWMMTWLLRLLLLGRVWNWFPPFGILRRSQKTEVLIPVKPWPASTKPTSGFNGRPQLVQPETVFVGVSKYFEAGAYVGTYSTKWRDGFRFDRSQPTVTFPTPHSQDPPCTKRISRLIAAVLKFKKQNVP